MALNSNTPQDITNPLGSLIRRATVITHQQTLTKQIEDQNIPASNSECVTLSHFSINISKWRKCYLSPIKVHFITYVI